MVTKAAWGLGAFITVSWCVSGCTSNDRAVDSHLSGLERSESFAADAYEQTRPVQLSQRESVLDEPAIAINGVVYAHSDLEPRLSELAGATVARELALEQAIEEELRRKAITLTEEHIIQEQERLLESIQRASNPSTQSQLADLIDDVRAARGLGPERFRALAARAAGLRMLVHDQVLITNDMLQLEYELVYGPRVQSRILTVPTASDAQRVLSQIDSEITFSVLAARHSTDASAERGGVIEPVSPVDPAYPAALREALAAVLRTGIDPDADEGSRVLGPLAVGTGSWVLVLPDSIVATDLAPTFQSVRDALQISLRERQERLLMAQLADQLLERVRVDAFSPSLEWAIEAEQRGAAN